MDLKTQLLAAGFKATPTDAKPDAVAVPPASDPSQSKQVRVARQSQGRGGKVVSVITGLVLREEELAALALALKQACGAGGTVRDGTIEIQGEHRDRLVLELQRRGFAAKRAGG